MNLIELYKIYIAHTYKTLIDSKKEITNNDISKIFDSKGNNILHYAIFQHNINLIEVILNKAKLNGITKELINHRNVDGTNPLGMAFLHTKDNNIAGVIIATRRSSRSDGCGFSIANELGRSEEVIFKTLLAKILLFSYPPM